MTDNINNKKNELNKIIENQTYGCILRAKAEWIEGAERNTKYFSNLEKKISETKTIQRLYNNNNNNNNNEITNPQEILNQTKTYYEKLYKKVSTENNLDEDFFANNSQSKISDDAMVF